MNHVPATNQSMGIVLTRGMPPGAVRRGAVPQGAAPILAAHRPVGYRFKKGRLGKFTVTRAGA